MKCSNCGEKFRLSIDSAPGIFLAFSGGLAVSGFVLWAFDVGVWPYFLFGLAGFIALQAEVNRSDYSAYQNDGCSRAKCPKCEQYAPVKLWSV